jgi:hypothetical protein
MLVRVLLDRSIWNPEITRGINSNMTESKGVHTAWLILAVLFFAGVMLWGYLDQNHYFYHVKLAHISSADWDPQKPKECSSWNIPTNQPVLECDAGHNELQMTVPVRFYGDTELKLQPQTIRLHWMCSKGNGSRPAISCKIS